MYFLGLSAFFCLGVLAFFRTKLGLLAFFILYSLWPTGNPYIDLNYKAGVFVTDLFWLGIFAKILYQNKGADKKIWAPVIGVLLLYALYFLAAWINGHIIDQYLLKDLRPLIGLMQVFALMMIVKDISFTKKEIMAVVLVGATSFFIAFLALLQGFVTTQDGFFQQESFRYLDGSAYVCGLYLLIVTHDYRQNRRLQAGFSLVSAFSALVLLIAGSRIIFASFLLSLLALAKSRLTLVKTGVIVLIGAGLFYAVSQLAGAERVQASLDPAGLALQLYTRFGPALEEIMRMDLQGFIFGQGLGATFFIPWLEYLGYESTSVSVDSAYLTLYNKFGLFSIAILFASIYLPLRGFDQKLKQALVLYFMVIFFASAIHYQSYGWFMFFFLIMVAHSPYCQTHES